MTTKREKVTLDLTVPPAMTGLAAPANIARILAPDYLPTTIAEAADTKAALDWLKDKEKARVEWWAAMKSPLAQLRERILAGEKLSLEPIRSAIAATSAKLLAWREAETRRRKEEEARRRAEAEAQAEATRQQQLTALEDAAKATASRIEKTALRSTAKALADAPIVPIATAPVPPPPKIAGLYERETWSAEVVDFNVLLVAASVGLLEQVVEAAPLNEVERIGARKFIGWLKEGGVAPIDAVAPNASRLNGLASQCRADLPIPGVRAVRKTTLVSRG